MLLELMYYYALDFTANKAARETGLSSRRVWLVYMRFRRAVEDYSQRTKEKVTGIVETDESFFGPKFKNRRKGERRRLHELGIVKRGRGAKILQQPVFGIYKRDGTVYIEPVKDTKRRSIMPVIKRSVVKGAVVFSDTWPAYDGLVLAGYVHKRIDHGKEEYVRYEKIDNVHINGIEGFWGYGKEKLLKYHGVKRKNLTLYLKEIEFRYNYRKLTTEEFVAKLLNLMMAFGP
jgi:transposase